MSHIRQNGKESTEELSYGTSEIVQKTGVTFRQLYYWESLGLVTPAYQRFGQRHFRRYGKRELERLLEIKAWLDFGYSLEAVRKMKKELEEMPTSLKKDHHELL